MTSYVDPFDIPAVATAAADLLEAHGWKRFGLWDGVIDGEPYRGGPTCAIGAIGVVCGAHAATTGLEPTADAPGEDPHDLLLTLPAAHALAELVDDAAHDCEYAVGVLTWNDDRERSAAQVIQAFRDLAVKHTPDAMNTEPPSA